MKLFAFLVKIYFVFMKVVKNISDLKRNQKGYIVVMSVATKFN
ncbi:hypothetical protein BCAH820_2611 [Bacillus cereus AH820]|uniref:Uncharacterized protein n=1 Tax=Bacillus cereus (strain AH820) TaxID=405535 RepID=B7JPV4_BACC0|nr:hypothetical protein BCAH820_2611 [Bacillus cereus AH820]ACQ46774.1 hypothetical protein BAA_2654 [Bacillus anthracis str. A0248]EDT21629.1 hypothetical protein BAM_2649 [Bacillus anthracis str. A0465]EEM89467.1 hypothetical protein bthur0012_24000 [Bacillus thuringiensis serovar pulsiensis BGSC 4CC1]